MKFALPLIIMPTCFGTSFLVVSCGAAVDENTENLNIVKEIKKFQNDNKAPIFNVATNKSEIKSIVTIENKGNESFLNDISKYVSVNDVFKGFLTKDNNKILNKITLATFAPKVGTKNLNIFLLVGNNRNDDCFIKTTIDNYFDVPFTYETTKIVNIGIKTVSEVITINKNDFDSKFDQLSKGNLELLSLGFNIDEENLNKIKNNINMFSFKKIQDDQAIEILFTNEATLNGYVFSVDGKYFNEIRSNKLVIPSK